ncbi:hypothetical protein [Flavobacterium davisii]|uniref:HNH endonuclease 5 domain-containing protein n=1 Tax=Flavobacterium davisii TaxID=2906077 RepID=A0A246GLV6_9FLAO|nr:hypothetical protein [Flavobacterium davisii]OWP85330.1 hypothetical protein BWK59_00300 [Flavobacterium davisii]
MSKKVDNRKKLFDKFSNQLHLLKSYGLIDIELKYDRTYICPICLGQFEESDIISSNTKNFLTEEDAPPEKLYGKRIALTCKKCNSSAGHQIDNHLINRIREIDDNNYYKGSTQFRNFDFEGENITAEITSNGDGTLRVLHRNKKNNPNLLEKFIYGIKTKNVGPLLNLKPKDYKIIPERVDLALLKTSYIITFSKFGYIFLLDDFYQNIRNQIKDMDAKPSGELFLSNQLQSENVGTYYVLNKNAKSIFNVFSLKTEYSETIVSSIIPLPNLTAKKIHSTLTSNGYNVNQPGKIGVNLDVSTYDMNADLFSDIDEIKKIINWKNVL